MAAIRSELLNFLSGTRVKVSLMLREHRQLDDGRFVLFPDGEQIELPYNAVVPGTVRYVENGALVRNEQFAVDEHFKISPDFYQDRTMIRGTTLGQNMYKIGGAQAAQISRDALGGIQQQSNTKTSSATAEIEQKAVVGGTGDELELLSLLIKGDRSKPLGEDGFELELFEQDNSNDDDDDEQRDGAKKTTATAQKKAKAAGAGTAATATQPTKESSLSKAMKEMDLDRGKQTPAAEKPPSRKGSRKGKQLLEMMDKESAAEKTKTGGAGGGGGGPVKRGKN